MTNSNDDGQKVERDWRAVIVAVAGLTVILVGGIVALATLPGPVPKNEIDNASQNTVAIASAAFGAVAAVVSAYFGIKAANTAREESTKASQRSEIRAAHLAGATPDQAAAADDAAAETIQKLGL